MIDSLSGQPEPGEPDFILSVYGPAFLAAGWLPPEALEQVGWINTVGSVVPMNPLHGYLDDPTWTPVYRRAAGWTPPEGEKT